MYNKYNVRILYVYIYTYTYTYYIYIYIEREREITLSRPPDLIGEPPRHRRHGHQHDGDDALPRGLYMYI